MSYKIDWSIFDGDEENICYCRCGAVYRSHTKMIKVSTNSLDLISRKPCPACCEIKNNLRKVQGLPERWETC
jgi:hypothetical protein